MSEPTIQERIARAIDEIADHLQAFADEHPPGSRTRLQAEASIYTHRKCAEIARETSGWVAADERLPEDEAGRDETEYLAHSRLTGFTFVATWDATNLAFRDDEGGWIPGTTHWMPLPDPPESPR